MTLQELPIDVQEKLRKDRLALKNNNTNGAYRIRLWSNDGTRYFFADRKQSVYGEIGGKPIFDGRYYDRETNTIAVRNTRQYKHKLYLDGKIKEE